MSDIFGQKHSKIGPTPVKPTIPKLGIFGVTWQKPSSNSEFRHEEFVSGCRNIVEKTLRIFPCA